MQTFFTINYLASKALEKKLELTVADSSSDNVRQCELNFPHINVIQLDINEAWNFTNKQFDIGVFSLVLEHIKDLEHIFKEASKTLRPGGYIYIGELHPYKQYSGTKARFDTPGGLKTVACFDHHISDFVQAAKKYGCEVVDIQEYFDADNRKEIPRILAMILMKNL